MWWHLEKYIECSIFSQVSIKPFTHIYMHIIQVVFSRLYAFVNPNFTFKRRNAISLGLREKLKTDISIECNAYISNTNI